MPIDYKKYPKNWKTVIRPSIMKRAGNRCELCGAPHNTMVARPKKEYEKSHYQKWYFYIHPNVDHEIFNVVKIIITVHHIDFNIKNNDPCNLIGVCQKCHLRLDRAYKKRKRKRLK